MIAIFSRFQNVIRSGPNRPAADIDGNGGGDFLMKWMENMYIVKEMEEVIF